jgi:hypothetical protein
MTTNITAVVRPSATQENRVEVTIPDRSASRPDQSDASSQTSNIKITSNSIAEATASAAELQAITRALPSSVTGITFPRTLLQPTETAELIDFIDTTPRQATFATAQLENSAAVSNYQRANAVGVASDFLLNDLA